MTLARRIARFFVRAHRALRAVTAAVALAATAAHAQAPFGTDVLKANRAQFRVDLQSHVAPEAEGGWVWSQPSLSYGLGHGLEVGAGLSIVAPRPLANANRDVTLMARWAPLAVRKSLVQLAVGAFAFVPSERERDGVAVPRMTFTYLAVSGAVIPSLGDASPRLTVAGYLVEGPRAGPFSDRNGFSATLDQALPLSLAKPIGADVLLLQANHVSGKTAFSYSSASLIAVFGDVNVSVGYARGNPSAYNHGPSLGVGFTF